MARPLRIQYEGAWYHVMNRGAGRRAIFRSDSQRALFLSLLADVAETFDVAVHAYCLMGNHYHLLVCTPRGNLSRAMRHLNGLYTQRYNRSVGTDGPLFRGRYKAILVDADNYLAQVSRYIHLNPVEAGIIRAPGRYRWSSYRTYVGRVATPAWLQVGTTLGLFGRRDARRRYRAFVERGVDEEIHAFYGKKRLDPVLGREAFRERLRRRWGRKGTETEIPQARHMTARPSIARILQQTARGFQVDVDSLYEEGRGRGNLPRAVGMYLCRRLGGYPLREIAEAFRVSAYTSVSVAASRLTGQMVRDPGLKRKVERVQRSLRLGKV